MLDELDKVKHFLSYEVYNEYKKIICELNSKNLRQMYDELNVKTSSISNVSIDDNYFTFEVKLVSRYMDYILDKSSFKVVSGNNSSRVEKAYKLILIKKRDSLNMGIVRRCPGCGNSIGTNSNGICAYCGVSYNLEDYDYVLTSIKCL